MINRKNFQLLLFRAYSAQANLPVPVIKIPKYVTQHVEKAKRKGLLKDLTTINRKKIAYRGNTSIPVISSTQGDFNHYLGQLYHENYKLPIQSEFWFKAKYSGQKFTIHTHGPNPALPSNDPDEYIDDEYFPNEFTKLKLNEIILDSLHNEFKFEKPTRIQTLAVPRILSGQHVLAATETGSGKTISYLAPIIHQLCLIKKENMAFQPDTPLAVIITPGRELAEQIAMTAFRLAQNTNVNVKVLIPGGTGLRQLKLIPRSNIDLLVASVGCLKKLFTKGKFMLGNVRHFVLDEADTLLDNSFFEITQYILQRLPVNLEKNSNTFGTQLIFMSSIFPSNLHSIFNDEFKEEMITKICSPYLHRVPCHVEQRFWRVSNDGRAGELLSLVKNDYQKKRPVLIFCNKSITCEWLSHFLEANDIPNAKIHGEIDPFDRSKTFRDFQNGFIDVLCCSDLVSRGLDTQRARHVINFDMPNNVSDYLLRSGRVGRVGTNHGLVTNFTVGKSGTYTVMDIERAIRKKERISNVDSNIKQKIEKLYFTY